MFREIDDPERAGIIVSWLEQGATVATDVYDPEKSKAAGPVYLKAGDHLCEVCGALIEDEFGGAPYGRILANQRLKYGYTVCAGCLGKAQPQQRKEVADG